MFKAVIFDFGHTIIDELQYGAGAQKIRDQQHTPAVECRFARQKPPKFAYSFLSLSGKVGF
jgi:hypothetical protein